MATDPRAEISPLRSLEGLRLVRVRQVWDQPNISDVAAVVTDQLHRCGALQRIRPGDRVAITAGSRGIAALPSVLRAVIRQVRSCGGEPFLFPAMGSHGGGTAEGQRALLAGLGISEETMGAPILATMEVTRLGEIEEGVPVYLDAIAATADGIILVNRVKKHTNYDGSIESGLCKMAVIGMGKHAGAVAVHQHGNYGLREYIPRIAEVVFERAPILAGLALVENACCGLAEIVGLAPDEIVAREPALLERAKELSAKIPFHRLDILVVERMGKEFSGTGMDCYVIGRRRIIGEPEWPEAPQIGSVVVLRLTEASHGNAVGVGLADFCTRALADAIDWGVTKANAMTSGNLERVKLPLVYDADRQALEAAAFRERSVPLNALRLACIQDTLHLGELIVSAPLAEEAGQRPDLVVLDDLPALPFDGAGTWVSPFAAPPR